MRAVIVAGGVAGDDAFVREQCAGADLLIAVDGGTLTLERLRLRPDCAVGDFDSAPPGVVARLLAAGVPVARHPAEKDATDTHLALLVAVERGATAIDLLGVLGGPRYDHMLAAVLNLALPTVAHICVTIRDPLHTIRLLHTGEEMLLHGLPGEYITLLALTDTATGVRGAGLRYPLPDTFSRGDSRGVSNELIAPDAYVSLEQGRLLVIHAHIQAETCSSDSSSSVN